MSQEGKLELILLARAQDLFGKTPSSHFTHSERHYFSFLWSELAAEEPKAQGHPGQRGGGRWRKAFSGRLI